MNNLSRLTEKERQSIINLIENLYNTNHLYTELDIHLALSLLKNKYPVKTIIYRSIKKPTHYRVKIIHSNGIIYTRKRKVATISLHDALNKIISILQKTKSL